ncbi:MAG: Arylsulfate sulfotransferase AssT [Ignavibacteria bacterium]|nr:Arylsulfate sulfotransferase AssT [Ignavibacteria bacterium]
MKIKVFLIVTTFAAIINFTSLLNAKQFVYMSPVPASILNNLNTNIILLSDDLINIETINNNLILVKGSKSGEHTGKFLLSDDGKTLVFNPAKPFRPSEEVTVLLKKGISSVKGDVIEEVSFNFKTTSLTEPINYYFDAYDELKFGNVSEYKNQDKILGDTLPKDLMPVTVATNNKPDSGSIFFANMVPMSASYSTYLTILNDTGKVIKYNKISSSGGDFTVQPNGLYSYVKGLYGYICDSTFKIFDSVTCQNGYRLDLHEFLVLPNGHFIVMAYDPQYVDMSLIVNNGSPNARVTGCIIQELDKFKNVIFQWRTWDHFKFTDTYQSLTSTNIDPYHLNSIFVDYDGNLITSHRHTSEITKISRTTGEVIWRLGGKNNQFTFTGEHWENSPIYFSYQHDARRINNGNILFFDNGNQHSTQYSRAVEYKIDEVKKTAELAWEFRRTPDIYGSFMGSAQRLPNGNTFICWGGAPQTSQALITEVRPDKTIALELFIPKNYTAYRAHKFYLPTCPSVAAVTHGELFEKENYSFNKGTSITGIDITFDVFDGLFYPSYRVERFDCPPVKPIFDTVPQIVYPYRLVISANNVNSYKGEFHLDVSTYPPMNMIEGVSAYYKDKSGIFHRIPTTNNKQTKKLTFTYDGLGEIIFGLPGNPSLPAKPVLWLPADSAILNNNNSITFTWSNPKDYEINEITIFNDSNKTFIIHTASVFNKDSYVYTLTQLAKNKTIYWQVRAQNQVGYSPWSDVWSVKLQDPFIQLVTPNGGEVYLKDSSNNILRWEHNLSDMVKVELYRNGVFHSLIRDNLLSPVGGVLWKVPMTVPNDTTYSVKVTSKKDTSLFSFSSKYFTIKTPPAGVNETDLSEYFEINVFPNPAEQFLNFDIITKYDGNASLKLFNISGAEVAVIIDNCFLSGEYSRTFPIVNLVSGNYFYKFDFKGFSKIGKIEIIR